MISTLSNSMLFSAMRLLLNVTRFCLYCTTKNSAKENYENCTKFFNRIWRFGRALETCSISLFKAVSMN